MILIKKYNVLLIIFSFITLSINAQKIFDVAVYPSYCLEQNGSIYLSLIDPASPPFPFPYTVGLENTITGTEKYYEMINSSLLMNNLYASTYLITIYFNETCKLELSAVVGNLDEVINPQLGLDCGGSYISLDIDPSNYQITWYKFNGHDFVHQVGYDGLAKIYGLDNNKKYKFEVNKNGCLINGIIETGIVTHQLTIGNPAIDDASCTAATGKIVFYSGTVEGGTVPRTYLWSNGATTLDIGELSVGNYTITITDANGCTASKSFEVIPNNLVNILSLTPSCTNSNSGSCSIFANELNGELPTFSCQVPFEFDGTTCNLYNLAIGTYCVTISYPMNNCSFDKCFEILAKDPFPLNVVTYKKDPSCTSLNNGTISLTATGGSASTYNYIWSNGANVDKLFNLGAGQYIVTVSDACNNSVIEEVSLTAPQFEVEVIETFGCSQNASCSINLNVAAVNLPVNYKWSNNTTNSNISSSSTKKGIYNVTVTDSKGCTIVKNDLRLNNTYIDLPYEISTGAQPGLIQPCAGFNNGEFVINIHNPKMELFNLYLDGFLIHNTEAAYEQFLMSNLFGNVTYNLSYTTPSCSTNQPFPYYLKNKATDKKFIRYDDEERMCYYDEVCDGEIVGHDTYSSSPIWEAVEGNWIDCSIPLNCPFTDSEPEDEIDGDTKTMSAAEWYIVADVIERLHPGYYDPQVLAKWSSKPRCYLIRVCDKTWMPHGGSLLNISLSTFFGQDASEYSDYVKQIGNGCYEIEPCEPGPPIIICPNLIIPTIPTITANQSEINEIYNCKPKQVWLTTLTENYDKLIKLNPNNKFVGSQLDNYLSDLKSQIEGMPDGPEKDEYLDRLSCASVRYCAKDFDQITDDIDQVICGLYDHSETNQNGFFVPIYTCQKEHYNLGYPTYTGGTIVYCSGDRKYFSWFIRDDKTLISVTAKNGPALNYNDPYILVEVDSTDNIFRNFGGQYYKNINVPFSIVDRLDYRYVTKYEIDEFFTKKFHINDGTFLYILGNFEKDQIFTVSKTTQSNSFTWESDGGGNIRHSTFNATELLISSVKHDVDTIIIKGKYKGSLIVEGHTYSGSIDKYRHFTIYVLHDGTLLRVQTIGDYEEIESYASGLSLLVQKGSKYFRIKKFNNYTNVPNWQYETLEIDTTYIIKQVFFQNNNVMVMHLSGRGGIFNNGDPIFQNAIRSEVIVKIDDKGNLIDNFTLENVNDTKFTSNEIGELIGFVNTNEKSSLNNIYRLNNSEKSEATILKMPNMNFDSLFYFKLDGADGIEVKDISANENYVFFGGNILPTEKPGLVLGRTSYFMKDPIMKSAFASYIFNQDLKPFISDVAIHGDFDYREKDNILYNIHPNPAKNSIFIESNDIESIKKEFEFINSSGAIIYKGEFQESSTIINISNWQAGVYFIKINDNTHNVYFYKFIKSN